jgi:hypothetical protein
MAATAIVLSVASGPEQTMVPAAAAAYGKVLATVAESMDRHGTTAWVASLGVILIGYSLATQEGHWSHLRSGEFVAVLVLGFLLTMAGVAGRLYLGIRATKAIEADHARVAAGAESAWQKYLTNAPKN